MIFIDLADSANLGENGSKALSCPRDLCCELSGDPCVCVHSGELVALSIVTLIPSYSHCSSSSGSMGVTSGIARFCITVHSVSSVASLVCTWFTCASVSIMSWRLW